MRTFFSGCLLILALCSQAQPFYQVVSAKSHGFGGASVAFADQWSLFNNVGGIARINTPQSMFSVHNRFNINELSSLHAGFIMPGNKIAYGVGVHHFGDANFQQNQLGLAFGHKIASTSWGIKVNFHQTSISGFGDHSNFIVEAGAITSITDIIDVGMYVYNLNYSIWSKSENINHPLIIRAGISFHPNKSFWLSSEIEKNQGHDPTAKIGMLYYFSNTFFASTGVQMAPVANFFGAGLDYQRFEITYAIHLHPHLDLSHLFSISYKWKNEN